MAPKAAPRGKRDPSSIASVHHSWESKAQVQRFNSPGGCGDVGVRAQFAKAPSTALESPTPLPRANRRAFMHGLH